MSPWNKGIAFHSCHYIVTVLKKSKTGPGPYRIEGVLAIVEPDEGHFGIGIDEGLLAENSGSDVCKG